MNIQDKRRKFCISALRAKGIFRIDGRSVNGLKSKIIFAKFQEIFDISVDDSFRQVYDKDEFVRNLRDKRKESKKSYVYFFVNYEFGFCKIGVSSNPEKRLYEVQTGCPFKLKLFCYVNGGVKEERILHQLFEEYHSNGEWFLLKGKLLEYLDMVKPVKVITSDRLL